MTNSTPEASSLDQCDGRYGTIRFFAKDTVVGESLRLYGEWAENELRFFRNFIPAGGTVLDVGAFIGTHTLAFAEAAGAEGRVFSFEPQPRSFELLKENTQGYTRERVQLFHAAVGESAGSIDIEPASTDHSINFGGLTAQGSDGDRTERVTLLTIDGLELKRCDFVKLDVEGMEDACLRGAARTLRDKSPVVYAECNSIDDGARCFAEFRRVGYEVFLHVVDSFNLENYFRNERNIFGPCREAGLIGVPPSLVDKIAGMSDPSWQLFKLHTLDDLAFGMFQKPQYFDEILRASTAAQSGGSVVSNAEYKGLEDQLAETREELNAELHKCASTISERDNLIANLRQQLNEVRQAHANAVSALTRIKKANFYRIVAPMIDAEMNFRDRTREARRRRRGGVHRQEPGASPTAKTPSTQEVRQTAKSVAIKLVPLSQSKTEFVQSDRPLMVVVSHVSPCPPRAGNEFRIHRMLQWLDSAGYDLLLVICALPGQDLTVAQTEAMQRQYPNLVIVERSGQLRYQLVRRDLFDAVTALKGRKVRDFAAKLNEDAKPQKLLSITRTYHPDIVLDLVLAIDEGARPFGFLANYGWMTRSFPLLRNKAVKLVDTHDVFSTKASKVVRFGIHDDQVLTPAEERILLSDANALIAIQPDEAKELSDLGTGVTILTVGVDMPKVARSPAPAQSHSVLLIGSDNEMNRKGLKDFLRFAWPLIRKQVPDAVLKVVGSVGRDLTGYETNVFWLGQLEDLEAIYAEAKVVVNPAIAGTGLKIKTLEALSHLRPIVVWPSGLDGISSELQSYCHLAADWFQFAQSVVDALTTSASDDALALQKHSVERLLSPEHVYSALNNFLLEYRRA